MQHTATRCNTLQHTAAHCSTRQRIATSVYRNMPLLDLESHCNTLQHTATYCNTLQAHCKHTANTLQTHCKHTATHSNTSFRAHQMGNVASRTPRRCCGRRSCVAVHSCSSVLQCVAVCRSMLQCVAVHCSALQCVAVSAVCCSVFQCVAVCCSRPPLTVVIWSFFPSEHFRCGIWRQAHGGGAAADALH